MEFNDRFFNELAHSPEVTGLCEDVANKIAATARSTAPRQSGDYADGIQVRVVKKDRRNVVLVESTDPKTMLIESRTGNLVRALNSVKRSG